MKKAMQDKWVRALRGKSPSGEYKQTTGFMWRHIRGEDRFCCLGVLVNECGDWSDYEKEYRVEGAQEVSYWTYTYPVRKFWLSKNQADWLALLNDKGRSFEWIADWIEENIEVEP